MSHKPSEWQSVNYFEKFYSFKIQFTSNKLLRKSNNQIRDAFLLDSEDKEKNIHSFSGREREREKEGEREHSSTSSYRS